MLLCCCAFAQLSIHPYQLYFFFFWLGSAVALTLSTGSCVLMDCGEGTQHQITRCNSIKPRCELALSLFDWFVPVAYSFACLYDLLIDSKIDLALITHLHGDHSFGLFGLICSAAMMGRVEPLTIVGPVGIRNLVVNTLSLQGNVAVSTSCPHSVTDT